VIADRNRAGLDELDEITNSTSSKIDRWLDELDEIDHWLDELDEIADPTDWVHISSLGTQTCVLGLADACPPSLEHRWPRLL
jgi:hypothetical protein